MHSQTALQRGSKRSAPTIPAVARSSSPAPEVGEALARFDQFSRLPGDEQSDLVFKLELATGWLDRDVRPRVVLTAKREVRWCNRSAARMLVPPQPLFLRCNLLRVSANADPVPLDLFLAGLGSESKRHLLIDPAIERGILLTGWGLTRGDLSLIFLEFVTRELPLDAATSGMAEQYGLTPAECEIVDILALMEAPAAIATRFGVSVNTVRTHIRRIYGKLNCTSQLQLMRTILAYCGG